MTADSSLWKVYADCFPIGAAVSPTVIESHRNLLIRHFNSIVAENAMKPCYLQPQEGRYSFEAADRIVMFAKKNGMKVRGHTLLWHNQTPDWFFSGNQGSAVSRDVLLGRMKEHISNVMGHFRGDVYCWDVVNEAIDDSSEKFLRQTPWLDIIGEDYISRAFEFAHAADQDALLFYNDYNESEPTKRDKICKLVRELKDRGVPIHGIGLQAHWNLFSPKIEWIREAIEAYAALGVRLQVTELDVSVYAFDDRRIDVPASNVELLEKQAHYYDVVFRLFREYRDVIDGVTFWGVADDATWLDNFPVRNRKNYPLLFDEGQLPKESFHRIIDFV